MPALHQPAAALGIDVAHYDGDVNWAEVLQPGGRSFGFVKATEGSTVVDSMFESNWRRMGEVGITRGAYHFFRGASGVEEQAGHFLNTVPFIRTDMPAVLDIEVTGGLEREVLVQRAKAWLRIVEERTGKRPIIYSYPSFFAEHLDDSFGDYLLWIAHFTNAARPIIPQGFADYAFWQYASAESGLVRVPGVPGTVDANRFNGTHAELVARYC